ncbi:MAG: hypothetical protein MJK12_06365 [Colwellia sp.]|nr:hypothetical protein [Colwellia sp.]
MVSKIVLPQSTKQLSEQELQAQILQLPTELSPERELWSGIEKAISDKRQDKYDDSQKQWHKAPIAWAASVVAAVLLTWGVISPQDTLNDSFNGKFQGNINLVAAMQQTFEQQKQGMLVSYGQPNLQDLTAEMQDQFKQLSSAQVTIKKALESEPNSADLLNLLRWTQQQELDLLKQLYSPQWQSI